MREYGKNTLKTVVAVALAGVIVCGCGVLWSCKGEEKTESSERKISSVATSGFDHFYTPGSEIDLESLSVVITYSDKSTKTLTEKLIDVDAEEPIEVETEDEGIVEPAETETDETYADEKDAETTDDGDEEEETSEEEVTKSIFDDGAEFILYTDGLYEELTLGHNAEGEYSFSCLLAEDMEIYDLGTVYIGDDITYFNVTLFEEPAFVTEYKANLERTGDKDDDNDFVKAVDEYCVGDDNGFVFTPKLTLSDPGNVKLSFEQSVYNVDVAVYRDESDEGEPLNLSDNLYVSYSDFTFDFTDEAVGEYFTIQMTLTDFDRDFSGTPIEPVTMTVKVMDGWNVYTALDLGHMSLVDSDPGSSNYIERLTKPVFWNGSTSNNQVCAFDIWKDFLDEKGEDKNTLKSTNGIYLQNNIEVTMDDIPEDFFIGEDEATKNGVNYPDMVGCIRDDAFPYTHYMTDDFTLNGNLFKIDCSTIKYGLTTRTSSGLKYYAEGNTAVNTSNSALISFLGEKDTTTDWSRVDDAQRHIATVENVELVGNVSNPGYSVSGKENGMAAGSLQAVRSVCSKLKMDNCICREFVMAVDVESTNSNYVGLDMKGSKIFDCYNCAVYEVTAENNYIRNSVFKRIGGPIVMSKSKTTDDGGDNSYGYYYNCGIEIDDDTVIENYLAGDEAWFVSMDVTFIPVLLGWFDEFFERVGKTIYTGMSTAVGADGEQAGSSAVNVQWVAIDNGAGSSSDTSEYLNCDFRIGDTEYMLSEETYTKTYLSDPENFASQAEYIGALSNYFMDECNYAYMPLVFSTNTGKSFTIASQTMSGGDPFYDLAAYALDSKLVPVELTEEDTEMFLYLWFGSIRGVLAMPLGDAVTEET
ncbi:MAG: hypothetical protein LUD29_05355 [Clostridia bacterium]|nr:hypothetical protein [Clostridia bacterium]